MYFAESEDCFGFLGGRLRTQGYSRDSRYKTGHDTRGIIQMAKAFVFAIPAILFLAYGICEGLECYHCYTGMKTEERDSRFTPCNEANLTSSNTWLCPSSRSQCIYETVQIESTQTQQIWRTCSNGISDPCDPISLPPGIKMIECTFCNTDKCNLQKKENKEDEKNFTFNISANISIFIKQGRVL